ncbi:MAG: MinD/ParA family protein [Planctomycetes bacterium]|nr:MinD/ParA family protein [Planctomycetota bacterium]
MLLLAVVLGLANVGLLLDLAHRHTLAHVVEGRLDILDAIVPGPLGIGVLLGATGMSRLADLGDADRSRLLGQFERLERRADLILVDTGAGVSRNVVQFVQAADDVLVVATPEPPSCTCAYAIIKIVCQQGEFGALHLVVNQARNRLEAARAAEGICKVSRGFLGLEVDPLGHVLADPHVGLAVRGRTPFALAFPEAWASHGIRTLADRLLGVPRGSRGRPRQRPPALAAVAASGGEPPIPLEGPRRERPPGDGFFRRLARLLR